MQYKVKKVKGLRIKKDICLNVLLLFILILVPMIQTAAVYVDSRNTSGARDGRSWDSAFDMIRVGIDKAFKTGENEVWVVAGTCHPTTGKYRSKSMIALSSGRSTAGSLTIEPEPAVLLPTFREALLRLSNTHLNINQVSAGPADIDSGIMSGVGESLRERFRQRRNWFRGVGVSPRGRR